MKTHDYIMLTTVGMGSSLAKAAGILDNIDIELVKPEREVAILSLMPSLVMPIENITVPELYRPPLTRKERRKLARQKEKK